jgi:hypothetical protein
MFLIKARMQVVLESLCPRADAQSVFRHTLLLCQSELSIIIRTRVKLLRKYSGLRVSEAFSVAWTQPF